MQTRSRRYSRAQCVCGTNAGLLSNREGIAPSQFVVGSISQTSAGTVIWYAPPSGSTTLLGAQALTFDWMLTNTAAVTVTITVTSGATPTLSYKINAATTLTGTSFTMNNGDRLRFGLSAATAAAGTLTFNGFSQTFSVPYSI